MVRTLSEEGDNVHCWKPLWTTQIDKFCRAFASGRKAWQDFVWVSTVLASGFGRVG
jgi:hypothetical protein